MPVQLNAVSVSRLRTFCARAYLCTYAHTYAHSTLAHTHTHAPKASIFCTRTSYKWPSMTRHAWANVDRLTAILRPIWLAYRSNPTHMSNWTQHEKICSTDTGTLPLNVGRGGDVRCCRGVACTRNQWPGLSSFNLHFDYAQQHYFTRRSHLLHSISAAI